LEIRGREIMTDKESMREASDFRSRIRILSNSHDGVNLQLRHH
jgi:hypothetical protein